MERPPEVLCIQLKQFEAMGGKISKPVQLQRQTDLSPFIKTSGQRIPVNYKLVAMITHVGPSPNCGHYTAIGEAAGGQFYQVGSQIVSSQILLKETDICRQYAPHKNTVMSLVLSKSGFFLSPAAENSKTQGKNSTTGRNSPPSPKTQEKNR